MYLHQTMPLPRTKVLRTFRLDEPTRKALQKKAREMGMSQANAIGVLVGAYPHTAYGMKDKTNDLVTRHV